MSANRYGFNGKENDNEVKGEGNQQDYGFRIYDPRVGRFLSVDPLTKGYPELTPYQFASNSPISGVDLDGGEYLNFNAALIQFKNGALELKLENMWTVTKNTITAYANDPKNWRYDNRGQKSQGFSLAVANFTLTMSNPVDRIGNGANIDNGHSFAVSPTSNNPAAVQNPMTQQSDGKLADKRFKYREVSTTAARPAVGRAAIAINMINLGLEGVGGWMITSDINNAKDQAERYGTLISEDINIAIGKGFIPAKYQTHESLVNIGNVILQGVNNTEDKEIYNIGMKIFNEISSKRFPQTGTIKSGLDNIPSRQVPIPRIDESKTKNE